MLQVFSLRLYRSSYIEDEVRKTLLSWIPPKVTIHHEGQRRKFFRQNLLQGQVSESVLTKLASPMLEAM